MKLAIITARGGSKRIPRKNIRAFCGKPMISYAITAAIESNCFDEVMVSTEDRQIAEIAKSYGAIVPFMRSEKNASDHATTAEVIWEVLQEYHKQGRDVEYACCIYPTAPFLTPKILRESLKILIENSDIRTVMPIVQFSYPIQRALWLKGNHVSFFNPEHRLTRSQDLEPAYHDAGQFYWSRISEFLKTGRLIDEYTAGIVLPEWQVQDIDNEQDWLLAEIKYRCLEENRKTLVVS